jgi:glyoxylase-like metal-dependent hydrolase (beta-lactamase superfamily II)
MKLIAVFCLLLLTLPAPDEQALSFRTVEVAEGVYAFHPSELGVGNVVAILTPTGVVVVDATLTPAGGAAIVAEIKRLTDQPVRTVVSTHAHDDHYWGNEAIQAAFPDARFVAHAGAQRDMVDKTIPGLADNQRAVSAAIATRESTLRRGTTEDGEPLSAEARKLLEARLQAFRGLEQEMAGTQPVLPTDVFTSEMTIDEGGLEIRIQHLGRGHTSGDVVVEIPARGVVVTGDLLTHPIPVVGEFMLELPATLRRLEALEFEALVPGHGEVVRGREHLRLVIDAVDALLRQVRQAVDRGLSLEETTEVVDLADVERRLFGDDATTRRGFRQFFLTPAIAAAHAAMTSVL